MIEWLNTPAGQLVSGALLATAACSRGATERPRGQSR